MPIGVVHVLTCNKNLISRIDSRYAPQNVGLRSPQVPFGSWQTRGCDCPGSGRCDLCPCNVVRGTNLDRAT